MTMAEARRRVLLAALERTRAFEAETPPPEWRRWDRDRYDEQAEMGPEYAAGAWYGDVTNADRQQLLRAVEGLERDGLVVRGSRYEGGKFTHLRLTDAGRAEAERLTAEVAT